MGYVLIFIGLLMMVAAIAWLCLNIVIALLKLAIEIIRHMAMWFAEMILTVTDYLFVTRGKKRNERDQLKRIERKFKQEWDDNEEKRQMVLGTIILASELRERYPNADRILFERMIDELPSGNYGIDRLRFYEDEIKRSHEGNYPRRDVDSVRTYDLNDLKNLTPLRRKLEEPILVEVYRIDSDYVLKVANVQTNEYALFQTKNYPLLMRYVIQATDEQYRILINKFNTSSVPLEDVIDERGLNGRF